jgi:hypothetical protein
MPTSEGTNWGNWILRALIALFVVGIIVAAMRDPQSSEATQKAIIQEDSTDVMTGNRSVRTRRAKATVIKPENAPASAEAFLYFVNRTSEVFPDGLPRHYLIIEVESGTWNFSEGDPAYFLVDGKRYRRTVDAHNMGVGASVSEEIAVQLKKEQFRGRLATASEVKVKVGRYVWDVTEAVNEEMQAFHEAI